MTYLFCKSHSKWTHLSNLQLANPNLGQPGRRHPLRHGHLCLHGRPPVAFETKFGWVLAGRTNTSIPSHQGITSHHVAVVSDDDLLHKYWKIEGNTKDASNLPPEELSVVQHFHKHHTRTDSVRFIVPLPEDPQTTQLGEFRSQTVRRFFSLECSLHSKTSFKSSLLSSKNTST